MKPEHSVGGRATRGRVVMLVDNGVRGDSRVQKTARSAAEAGWDVTLIGFSPDKRPAETFAIGGATVRLLYLAEVLNLRPRDLRRALRWPLAYPPNGIAPHRAAQVLAWLADLRSSRSPRSAASRVQLVAANALRRWVSGRYWMLTRQRQRRNVTNLFSRAYARFWRTVRGDRAWRRLDPGLWEYELSAGPLIDELAPDLIHANDVRMLGVGARAVIRARADGRTVKLVWDAHEFVPGLPPPPDNPRWLPAHTGYEREYAPYADAVITVSDALADLLMRNHGLATRPGVVLNAPVSAAADDEADQTAELADLRAQCGIAAGVPLVAYCGSATAMRGVDVLVDSLPELAGVHLALVSLAPNRPTSAYVLGLMDRAKQLGVTDRVHLLPYVAHWQVPQYLSTADLAVSPLLHVANHEIALSNKFFEYSHARLPLVVSDVKTMADTVRATGQGEVFRAGDRADYVRAVRAVLADPQRYRNAYDKPDLLDGWTWDEQARRLDGIYDAVLARRGPSAGPVLLAQADGVAAVSTVRA